MTGFKSYGPSTVTVPLSKGFTAIAGPNGSGKSNSVDAIVFCLGGLSTKSLRADKMVDLLYNGIGGKKPAERAIVEIIFDNSDHAIPVPDTEVSISRELRRDGQSIYRFNGKRSTRQEIMDKLRVAGIDISGFNIIQQGQINQIISMNPVQRRELIEEIAGVKHFEEKKQQALIDLEAAEQRMEQLQIMIHEVAKRVEILAKEKAAAEKWQKLAEEIQLMKSQITSFHYHNAMKDITAFNEKIGQLEAQIEELELQIAEDLVPKIEELEEEIVKREHEIREIENQIKAKGMEINQISVTKGRIEQKSENDKKNIEESRKRIETLRKQKEELSEKEKADEKRIEEIQKELEEKKKILEEVEEETEEFRTQIELQEEEYQQLIEKQREIEEEIKTLERRKNHALSNLQINETQLEHFQQLAEKQQKMLQEKRAQLEEKRTELSEIQEQLKKAEQLIEDSKKQLAATEGKEEEYQKKRNMKRKKPNYQIS